MNDYGRQEGSSTQKRIALCSGLMYPMIGGVEYHVLQLARQYCARGHHVIILAQSFPGFSGVRYLEGGFKIYYMPMRGFAPIGNSILPSAFSHLGLYHNILRRERIGIVHGHQAGSYMGLESVWFGHSLGLTTCFTDHSLIGMGSVGTVVMNKFLSFTLACADAVVGVSRESTENTLLRSGRCFMPGDTLVRSIPNAVDTEVFKPCHERCPDPENGVRVVAVSRLSYRKGTDLLIQCIKAVLDDDSLPKTFFDVIGTGSERYVNQIQDLVNLSPYVVYHGSLPHKEMVTIQQRGHISLCTSLTEAFCMAVVEGAAVGLEPVSTAVGGVVGLLGEGDITLCRLGEDMDGSELVDGLKRRIMAVHATSGPSKAIHRRSRAQRLHDVVAERYNWSTVAEETLSLYDDAVASSGARESMYRRARGCRNGVVSSMMFTMTIVGVRLVFMILDWWMGHI